jgi:hypothetical protein
MMREGRPSFGTRYRRPVSDHAEGAGRAALTPNPSPRGRGETRTSPLPFSLGEKVAG